VEKGGEEQKLEKKWASEGEEGAKEERTGGGREGEKKRGRMRSRLGKAEGRR